MSLSQRPVEVAAGGREPLPESVVALLATSSEAVVAVGDGGVVVYANEQVAQLVGCTVEQLLGSPVGGLVVDDDRATLLARVDAVASGAGPPRRQPLLLRVARRDRPPVEIDVTTALLEPGGGHSWVVMGLHDVSARVEEERRVSHLSRAYLMLAQLNQAVIDSAGPQALFDSTTRICVEQGGFLGSSVAVPAPDGSVRIVSLAGEVEAFVASLVITTDPADPHGRGPTGRALRDGTPCFVPDFLTSEVTAPWREVAVRHGVGAVVALPLRTDGRVVASLSIYADRATAFDQGVAELFGQVAANVSYALDGYVAEQALVAEVHARHALMRRLVTAEETERARIAAGLHDDSVQTLAAVELRLGLLLRTLERSPGLDAHAATVRTILSTVGLASTSLRQLLFELEPPLLAQPLVDALQTVAGHTLEHTDTTWSVQGAETVTLPDGPRAQALRIVKEALINVRKHARASHVVVEVRDAGPGVELSVTDDGVGLPAPDGLRLARPGHRGLETMRDRAAAAGGWLQLERPEAGGTRLCCYLPLTTPS